MHHPAGKQPLSLSVCHMTYIRTALCGLIAISVALINGCARSPQQKPTYVVAELFLNAPISIRPTGSTPVYLATSSPSDYFLKEPSGRVLLPSEYDPTASVGTTAVLAAGEIGAVIVRALVRKIATATVKPSSKEFVEKINRMKTELPEQLSTLASETLKANLQKATQPSSINVAKPSSIYSTYNYTWAQSARFYQPSDVINQNGYIVEFGFFEIATENGYGGGKGKVKMGIAIIDPITRRVVGRDSMTDTFSITVEEDSPEYEEQVTADFKKSTIKLVDELVKKVVRQS
jgi:hypothetical protein